MISGAASMRPRRISTRPTGPSTMRNLARGSWTAGSPRWSAIIRMECQHQAGLPPADPGAQRCGGALQRPLRPAATPERRVQGAGRPPLVPTRLDPGSGLHRDRLDVRHMGLPREQAPIRRSPPAQRTPKCRGGFPSRTSPDHSIIRWARARIADAPKREPLAPQLLKAALSSLTALLATLRRSLWCYASDYRLRSRTRGSRRRRQQDRRGTCACSAQTTSRRMAGRRRRRCSL